MKENIVKNHNLLYAKYPPSKSCSCDICVNYCKRPGWWTVNEAKNVVSSNYSNNIMLEISPEFSFGVLSPAFKGNEKQIAQNDFSHNSCTFHKNNLCDLFGSGMQPLECRFCHHERIGLGIKCHNDIEKDWNTSYGKKIVEIWCKSVGLWDFIKYYKLIK